LLAPSEEEELLPLGLGITNLVPRATATAAELTHEDLIAGKKRLVRIVRRQQPRALAVLGVSTYRAAFARPKAIVGLQPDKIGDTLIWLLPNPSGLNANYQPAALARLFRELRHAVGE